MTAIGKLMAFALLVVGLGLMTWSVGLYVQRPGWFDPVPEGVDRGSNPVTFAQLKAETEALGRAAAVAGDIWGTNLKELEEREALRASRLKAFRERSQWARTGNPKDLIDAADPTSGKGFYAPVVDPALNLYDVTVDAAGKPKGEAIRGTDNQPLKGVEMLSFSVSKDIEGIQKANANIIKLRREFDVVSKEVLETDDKLIRMNVIRDSVRGELFYLDRFKGNVSETGETVFRRQKQLVDRLQQLGVVEP